MEGVRILCRMTDIGNEFIFEFRLFCLIAIILEKSAFSLMVKVAILRF